MLEKTDYLVIVIEQKDRLNRFGFNYIKTLREQFGRMIDLASLKE